MKKPKEIYYWSFKGQWEDGKEFQYMLGLPNDDFLFTDNGYEYHRYVSYDGYITKLKVKW